jgi:FtsP/CotA-like multicopper oxidase with cupredoxin domain
MSDLTRGVFNGQFAFAYIEPKHNNGNYDREVFLATHEWEPYLTSAEQHEDCDEENPPEMKTGENEGPQGWEVAYRYFTINGKCLGHGDPVRVKEGQRVLFHFLNASATESVRLALPGHQFQVIALDGNPVPNPRSVGMLELGTAERVDAIVEMNTPGVWILGSPMDSHRRNGMGIVVEYSNRSGNARWIKPTAMPWDYTLFGVQRRTAEPDEVIPLVIERISLSAKGFEQWTLNGRSFDSRDKPRQLAKGRRYRLAFDNRTDDAHPVHLHRSSFEVTNVGGKATAGLMKDVVVVKSFSKIEVDVTPSMEGLMLFHCHQQLHMDNGFKMLFNVT